MKTLNIIKSAAILLPFLAAAIPANLAALEAQPAEPQFDLHDQKLFPPEFFPGLQEQSDAAVLLAGLRSIYPKRILDHAPRSEMPEPTPPVVRELGKSGTYIRVLNLQEALPIIEEHFDSEVLLLDFRFLAADLESTIDLGAMLSRQSRLEFSLVGDYPSFGYSLEDGVLSVESRSLRSSKPAIFTLSNHLTRGPIEALLDQLKTDGDIISIGTASAGRTAIFHQFPTLPSYYLMTGEIRAQEGNSLVESGFVPQVNVSVTPDNDLIGYSGLRKSVTIDQVIQARVEKLRFDEATLLRERGLESSQSSSPATKNDEADEIAEVPLDLILQRAMNIVKALQALGRIGE